MNTFSVPVRNGETAHYRLRKFFLFCGILSSLWYFAINIIVPLQYPGYSISSQTVSELSAIGAPTRTLWVLLVTFFSALAILFGLGVWQVAAGNRTLRLVAIFLLADALIGIFWPPMHRREVLAAGGGTISDTLHIVFTFVTIPLKLLAIGFAAGGAGKLFRFISIATMIIMLAAGIVTGLDSPEMEANLPTPWMGIWERISIGVYFVWVIVFSILMVKQTKQ